MFYLLRVVHMTLHSAAKAAARDFSLTNRPSDLPSVRCHYQDTVIDGEFYHGNFGTGPEEYSGFPDHSDFFQRFPSKVCYFEISGSFADEIGPSKPPNKCWEKPAD